MCICARCERARARRLRTFRSKLGAHARARGDEPLGDLASAGENRNEQRRAARARHVRIGFEADQRLDESQNVGVLWRTNGSAGVGANGEAARDGQRREMGSGDGAVVHIGIGGDERFDHAVRAAVLYGKEERREYVEFV